MFQPDKLFEVVGVPTGPEAAPFTLESLIAWLRTKRPEESYDYWCNECLIGQYTAFIGLPLKHIGTQYYQIEGSAPRRLPPGFDVIAHCEPRTFNAALSRALAYQAGVK